MTNVRTGAAEFVVMDSQLASDMFKHQSNLSIFNPTNYIILTDGAIYAAVNKVMPKTEAKYTYADAPVNKVLDDITIKTYTMADAATLEFATGKYFGKNYVTYEVGTRLDGDEETLVVNGQNVATPTELTSMKALLDVIAGDIYTTVYDNDFDLDLDDDKTPDLNAYSTDLYYNILSNVTFVHHAANGLRYEWKAAQLKSGSWQLTDATAYGFDANWKKSAFAHVMYDYANIGATVYLDTFSGTVIVDEVALNVTMNAGCEAKDVVPAVVGAKTGYDKEAEITYVVVETSKKIKTPVITAGTATVSNIVVVGKTVSFQIAGKYTGAVEINAELGLDVALLTKVTGLSDIKQHGAITPNGGKIEFLIDGMYAQADTFNEFRYATVHDSSTRLNSAFEKVPVGDANYNDAKHLAAFTMKLKEATDLKAFRLAVSSHGNEFLLRNFSIMTKTADGEWKTAFATTGKIVNGSDIGAWEKIPLGSDPAAKADYFVYDVELATNNKGVVEVAFMINVVDAAGNIVTPIDRGTWKYFNISEFEFYK